MSLTAFYAASLVLALSHIHKQGIVFRDLKPENIMLDNTGYLRGKYGYFLSTSSLQVVHCIQLIVQRSHSSHQSLIFFITQYFSD